jgi:hypothetical protein
MARRINVVGSCGGSNAIIGVATVGATLSRFGWEACHCPTIGGASGTTIIAAIMRGSGLSDAQVIDLVLSTNFAKYVECERMSRMQRLRMVVQHKRAEAIRPWALKGPVNSEPLGDLIDKLAPGPWPPGLWILAVDEDGNPVLFSEQGIFRLKADGSWEELSAKPPSLGLAVRAACTVPMLFTPPHIPVNTGSLPMWDGAFCRNRNVFGLCPVNVPINHLHVSPEDVLAFDVSKDAQDRGITGLAWHLVRHYCWGIDAPSWPAEAEQVIRIAPTMPFSGWDLDLTADKKWKVIAVAISGTTRACLQHGLVPEEEAGNAARLLEAVSPFVNAPLPASRRLGFAEDLKQTLIDCGFRLSA